MIRRLFWFVLGAVSALFVASWFKKKAAELGEKMTVENVARSVVEHGLAIGRRIADVSMDAWRAARSADAAESAGGKPGSGEGGRG